MTSSRDPDNIFTCAICYMVDGRSADEAAFVFHETGGCAPTPAAAVLDAERKLLEWAPSLATDPALSLDEWRTETLALFEDQRHVLLHSSDLIVPFPPGGPWASFSIDMPWCY